MEKQKSVGGGSLKRACRHLDERSKEHLKDVQYQDPFRESVALVDDQYFPPEYRGCGIDNEEAFLEYGKKRSKDDQGRPRIAVAAHFTLSPPDEISALIMGLEGEEREVLLIELKEFYDAELSTRFFDAPRGIAIHAATIRPHFEAIVMMYFPDNKGNGGFWHVNDGRTDLSAEAALAAIHGGDYWMESFHCKISHDFTKFAAGRLREIYRRHERSRKDHEDPDVYSEAFFKRFNAAWEYFGFLKIATTSHTLMWRRQFREKLSVKIPGVGEPPAVESYERLKSVIGPDCPLPEVRVEPSKMMRLARSRAARILLCRRQEPPWISLMWRDARLNFIASIRHLRKFPRNSRNKGAVETGSPDRRTNLAHEDILSIYEQFNFVDRWEAFELQEPAFLTFPMVFHLDKPWPTEVLKCMQLKQEDIERLFFDPAIEVEAEPCFRLSDNPKIPKGLKRLIDQQFLKALDQGSSAPSTIPSDFGANIDAKLIYQIDAFPGPYLNLPFQFDPIPTVQKVVPPITDIAPVVSPPDRGLEI